MHKFCAHYNPIALPYLSDNAAMKNDVEKIKSKLMNLGPFLPGSLSVQWNVCGKKSCACKDPNQPKKHGPYNQLSFRVSGKSSSLFIKEVDVPEAKKRIKRYAEYKELTKSLIEAHIDLVRKEGFN